MFHYMWGENYIKKIYQSHCTQCHIGSETSGYLNLSLQIIIVGRFKKNAVVSKRISEI